MSRVPSDQSAPRSNANNQASEQIHRVANTFEAYTCDQKAADAKNAKNNRKIRRWTRAATVGAIAYTIISAFILIITIRSVYEAGRAADAASRQANISNDTEWKQLRAYVGPVFGSFKFTQKMIDCSPSADPNVTSAQTFLCYRIQNYGLTPARLTSYCHSIRAISQTAAITRNMIASRCFLRVERFHTTVWPGEVREVNGGPVDDSEINDIMKSTSHSGILYLQISYFDIFGNRHHTYICRSVHFIARNKGIIDECEGIQGPEDD